MSKDEATIVFQPSGRRGRVPLGINLLEASRRIGVDIEGLCGGQHVCGKCKVAIMSGRFEKFGIESKPENAGPWTNSEDNFITPAEIASGMRLACATTVMGDLLVDVPESSRAAKQVVSKAARDIPIDHDPAVKTYAISVPEPSMENPIADLERLCTALSETTGLSDLTIDLHALRALPSAITNGKDQVAVSVWQDREIIQIHPQPQRATYGLAIDVGTTTIAGYLCDLKTMAVVETATIMNPQVKFGEDVISRITYHQNNEDGLETMSRTLIDGLNRLIEKAVKGATKNLNTPIDRTDVADMAICGNTAMHHILLQLDPAGLGVIPFAPVNHHSLDVKARDLRIEIHPGAYIYFLPNTAGFVGGDSVGVILAEQPHRQDGMELIIDIGTNGELVLGDTDGLMATSCATGPALEGAQIEFGMRAAPGAIERVKIDPETHAVDYKVVGRDAWRGFSDPKEMQAKGICGSGILDVMAELYKAGIVKKSGVFDAEHPSPHLRINSDSGIKEFVLAPAAETSIGRDVVITQMDVRQIQLAKAAIYTGCKFMLRRKNVQRPDRVKIAGAFGTHVDRTLALVMGLFPDCPVESVAAVGNAAGDGCRAALLDRKKRTEADWVARHVEYIELTFEDDFQWQLMEATQFPHMSDPFPHLEGLVPQDILNQER